MGYHDCAFHGVGNTVIKEQEIGRQQSVTIRTAAFCSFLTKQKLLIMATGGGISVVVVNTAIYMIVRTTQEIREYKRKIKE